VKTHCKKGGLLVLTLALLVVTHTTLIQGARAEEPETATSTSTVDEANASSTPEISDEEAINAAAERIELEAELADLERQIAEQQETVDEYKTQGKTLKSEINYLNSRIKKLNLQIQTVEISLAKVNQEIIGTQKDINRTENKIDLHKEALGNAVRSIYEAEQQGLIEIILANQKLSNVFNAINDIALVQANLNSALQNIVLLRGQLLQQKQELALEKEDTENLKAAQEQQKRAVGSTQNEKENLLTVTKGKESEYQKILDETKKTAAEIRSRIFRLLGGGELTFEKAYELAKVAEDATGVRAPFILAILNQESNFGRNVGQCRYNEIIPQTGTTVMSPKQIPTFLEILGELGVDPESRAAYVSCPILRDGNHGGAMGPAQFIPSTWKLYKEEIAKVTGSSPPSPWNNADAFSGTALYLKDSLNSRSCRNYATENKHISPTQLLQERCAASQYYAGSRWHRYRWVYGEPVITKAAEFEDDIAILEG
jgi:membrane-bound lytic murein transglycosylase B